MELPLREGQLVYLCDHGVRGRHKIHDLWNPTVYQVVKAPQVGGSVYTIAPVGDLEKLHHVHRSSLKPQAQGEVVLEDPENQVELPVEGTTEEELVDGDLAYVVSAIPPVALKGPVVGMYPSGVMDVAVFRVDDAVGNVPADASGSSISSFPVPVPTFGVPRGQSGVTLRRTGRVGARQHTNVHHFPRAVGRGDAGPNSPLALGSNAVRALFRPWC